MGMIYREIKQALIDIDDMFKILHRNPRDRRPAGRRPARDRRRGGAVRDVHFAYVPERRSCAASASRCRRPHRRDRRPSGAGKSTLSRCCSGSTSRNRAHHDRRAGHRGARAGQPARRDRHGAAGYRAVQRHDRLQHPLRPLGGDRGGDARGSNARPDRPLHRRPAEGYDTRSASAPEAVGRREAARRHRPHHPEGPPILVLDEATSALDSSPSARSRTPSTGEPRPHHARHRPPPLDRGRRRRDHRPRPGAASPSAAPISRSWTRAAPTRRCGTASARRRPPARP